MLGDRLHACDTDAQLGEARLSCNFLTRMPELGTPSSRGVGK
jgi:hypothetical protein